MVVWLLLPNLWTRIVRRTCLCLKESLLGHLRDIQVTKLHDSILGDEEVCAFYISVYNFQVMQCLESPDNLNEVMPDLFFSEFGLLFLVVFDSLEQISTVSQLHDNAETTLLVFEESLFVSDNIRMIDGCQYPDLVDCVLLFLF